ncbi:MAG: hypothetical protein JRE57_06520 [Deltaproteobacteria bacterium]|nr:hypothetical protein [Deltaproteobacteria bacterium]
MEDPEARVVADVLGWKTFLLEIRHEFPNSLRIHHGTRKHVIANGRPLLENQHRRWLDGRLAFGLSALVERFDLLHQVQRRGQRSRSSADVEDVDLHALAFDRIHLNLQSSLVRCNLNAG